MCMFVSPMCAARFKIFGNCHGNWNHGLQPSEVNLRKGVLQMEHGISLTSMCMDRHYHVSVKIIHGSCGYKKVFCSLESDAL
jgi:hypothetical protein